MENFANLTECGCCKKLFFMVCGVRYNLYELSLYWTLDLDDRFSLLFTNINGCCAGSGCAYLFPVCV